MISSTYFSGETSNFLLVFPLKMTKKPESLNGFLVDFPTKNDEETRKLICFFLLGKLTK